MYTIHFNLMNQNARFTFLKGSTKAATFNLVRVWRRAFDDSLLSVKVWSPERSGVVVSESKLEVRPLLWEGVRGGVNKSSPDFCQKFEFIHFFLAENVPSNSRSDTDYTTQDKGRAQRVRCGTPGLQHHPEVRGGGPPCARHHLDQGQPASPGGREAPC